MVATVVVVVGCVMTIFTSGLSIPRFLFLVNSDTSVTSG